MLTATIIFCAPTDYVLGQSPLPSHLLQASVKRKEENPGVWNMLANFCVQLFFPCVNPHHSIKSGGFKLPAEPRSILFASKQAPWVIFFQNISCSTTERPMLRVRDRKSPAQVWAKRDAELAVPSTHLVTTFASPAMARCGWHPRITEAIRCAWRVCCRVRWWDPQVVGLP